MRLRIHRRWSCLLAVVLGAAAIVAPGTASADENHTAREVPGLTGAAANRLAGGAATPIATALRAEDGDDRALIMIRRHPA